MLSSKEFYHQKLAKALSNEFEAKLLLLDIVDFSGKVIYSKTSKLLLKVQKLLFCTNVWYLQTDAEQVRYF